MIVIASKINNINFIIYYFTFIFFPIVSIVWSIVMFYQFLNLANRHAYRIRFLLKTLSPSLCRLYSIQFSLCVEPIFTNYKFPSECFTICTHRHPWPLTSHRIRKNSQITLQGWKKGRNLQQSNRGGSLSRMDRTIDVMWPEGQI